MPLLNFVCFSGGAKERIFEDKMLFIVSLGGPKTTRTRWVSFMTLSQKKKIGRCSWWTRGEAEMQPGFTWTFESDKPSPPCYLLSPVGTFVPSAAR